MKFKIYTSVIALAFSVFGINAQKINIQKSTLEWIGKKIGGQHNGKIQLNSGEIKLANNKIDYSCPLILLSASGVIPK